MSDLVKETAALNMQTYKPMAVAMERGEGVYAFDENGNKYMDCATGYAVAALGHAHDGMLDVINKQAAKMMICQASYMTESKLAASKILIENSCFDQVFFTNSGTESVECALKLSRKWAYDNKSENAHEIIAFRNAFHGRSYGAASVTEKFHTQPFYAPYLPGVHFAQLNDLASVEALVSDKTAAIIIEPVQGEGGLHVCDKAFLQGLRDICDAKKIVLIYDEVQCGIGRLGTFYAYESFGVEPDIACLAKGMGGGFPVGACVAKEHISASFVPGTHGTTYGGNPLACAVSAYVTGEIVRPDFLAHVNAMGDHLRSGLEGIQARSNKVNRIAGMGLMLGIETDMPPADVIGACLKRGLMVTQSGADLVRMTPPLVISKSEIDEALGILETTLKEDF